MNNDLLQRIYDATNNGLDIILWYYPQAQGCDRRVKYFKIRGDERTASACMKEIKGVWRVTDFGDEGTALAPIDICMREEHKDFREALFLLADRYGVGNIISKEANKAKIEQRDATADEKDGDFSFSIREEITAEELAVLGPKVTKEVCARYNYYALEWYRTVKDRKVTTISSTPTYPIFMHDCGEFRKIYQPLNPDKAFRFFYKGNKPRDYLNGLDELKKAHEKYVKEMDEDAEIEEATGDDESAQRPKKSGKLPEAILCSGERDALNIAGLGYYPLWMNSETARLDGKTYGEIMKRVEVLYNLPDIDDTGIRKANELAMDYIDIRTIELPEWLATYKDHRGRPRKDLRDYVDIRPNIADFKELVKVAKPCRFWEKTYAKDRARYEINTLYLLHFLRVNGFGKLVDPDNDMVTYVKISGFKVRQISPRNIQDFILEWARERNLDVEIQNLILNSTRMSGSVFEKIDTIHPDFTNYDEKSQTLFFNNKMVRVTADGVEESRGASCGLYAWEKAVCKHDFKRIDPAFVAHWNPGNGTYSLELKHIRSHYFRFLMNASRIYWREEFEERASNDPAKEKRYRDDHHWDVCGPRLTGEEQEQQQRHLANKLFCIGYLMHSYKRLAKAWGLWVMENRITDEDESGGGSGKTFMIRFLKQFKNTEMVNGRDKKLTDNNFFLDRVTENTDLLLIDDAVKYFNFNYFYSMITDNMVVNYKNARSKEIQFSQSPKLVVTSNFPPPAADGSTARRLLSCVFSDYYHQQTDDSDYNDTVRIADDFGYELYNESYREEWWNEDFNFCIDCLQFYLQSIPYNLMLQPPMENVDKRMRIQQMGNEFIEWAEVYFSKGSENLDRLIDKAALKDIFDPKKKYSTKGFTQRLRAFCANTDYIESMNPPECIGYEERGRRIIRKNMGVTREYVYIRTIGTPVNNNIDG